ncbi:hypothetical protein [Mycolicibacterium sp. BK556]|nr:hypothetical protein [Mycolicibacterium sp. BK556]
MIVLFAIALLLYVGYVTGRFMAVPGTTEFWKVAGQPIATVTAAVLAIAAAGLALYGVHLSSSRVRTSAASDVEQRVRNERVGRCWERFEWLVNQIEDSDEKYAFPPELVVPTLEAVADEAATLKDDSLIRVTADYALFVFTVINARNSGGGRHRATT